MKAFVQSLNQRALLTLHTTASSLKKILVALERISPCLLSIYEGIQSHTLPSLSLDIFCYYLAFDLNNVFLAFCVNFLISAQGSV